MVMIKEVISNNYEISEAFEKFLQISSKFPKYLIETLKLLLNMK